MLLPALSTLTLLSTLVSAHGPETPEEVQAYFDRQSSAYHCAPAVAAYTAQRKRSFAQKVLGGDSTAHKNLFVDGYFDDMGLSSSDKVDKAMQEGKRLMSCDPVMESRIRNQTCVLAPEVTEGPYYHSAGHPIRNNIAEWELGLLFMMNIGVIDVNTCEPVPNVLVDIWHANATGYYAGHPVPAPDKINEEPASTGARKGLLSMYPRTVQEETWLRGALPTDNNGVAEFTSIFPGFYQGRATHVHTKIFPEWTTLENNTFLEGRLAHTGQFFVEDHINEQVDKIWPYSLNPLFKMGPSRGRTRNWDDSLKIYQESHANGHQPTFEVEPLGGVVSQGLIGYITVGIDMNASYESKWNPLSGKAGGKPAK